MDTTEKINELLDINLKLVDEIRMLNSKISTITNPDDAISNATKMKKEGKSGYEIMVSNLDTDTKNRLDGLSDKLNSIN
jgi:hypothetical protein